MKTQKGASAVEYAMLLALIVVVVWLALSVLGGHVNNGFRGISSGLGQSGQVVTPTALPTAPPANGNGHGNNCVAPGNGGNNNGCNGQ